MRLHKHTHKQPVHVFMAVWRMKSLKRMENSLKKEIVWTLVGLLDFMVL